MSKFSSNCISTNRLSSIYLRSRRKSEYRQKQLTWKELEGDGRGLLDESSGLLFLPPGWSARTGSGLEGRGRGATDGRGVKGEGFNRSAVELKFILFLLPSF